MTTFTVLQYAEQDDMPTVHTVAEAQLPDLLGGADAAWWILRFGWFGRRWVLVDHLDRSGTITSHDPRPPQNLGLRSSS